MASYEWAEGTRIAASAQEVGELIEAIETRDGVCKPGALIAEVEKPAHPLHDRLGITWNDADAAFQWRVHQARRVINSVVLVDDGKRSPAFVSVEVVNSGEPFRGYVQFVRVASDVDLAKQALAEVTAALEGWRKRHTVLEDLWDQIEATLKKARV